MTEAAKNRGLFLCIAIASAVSVALVAAWAVLNALNIVAPTYALHLSVITQAPTRHASLRISDDVQRTVERWIAAAKMHSIADVSQLHAIAPDGKQTRNWLTIAHYTVASRAMAQLDLLDSVVKRRSRWPVMDISRTGQFVQVPVRPGVTTLRLSRIVGDEDSATHVRLQISGPNVTFSLADLLPICLIVLLVLGFGAGEQNTNDAHAYPRGLHPAIVAGQILTLALFACFLITYARAGLSESRIGLLVLEGAVVLSMSRWLWITQSGWKGVPWLTYARRSVISLTVLLGIAGLLVAFRSAVY